MISRNDGGSFGDTSVALRPSTLLDPPILAAIPFLIWQRFMLLMRARTPGPVDVLRQAGSIIPSYVG